VVALDTFVLVLGSDPTNCVERLNQTHAVTHDVCGLCVRGEKDLVIGSELPRPFEG